MKRRSFLTIAGGAGAAVMFGALGRARAAPFGKFPTGTESVQLPDGVRAKRVLEIFLYGGMSQWETLYFVRNYGKPTDAMYPNQQYYALASANTSAMGACGVADAPRVVGTDAAGATVELGPFAARLWNRSDVVARTRIVVQKHALEPHEAAVPQALTGLPVGQPAAAGLGAHIQRARIDAGLEPNRAAPYSYVFATGGVSSDNVAAAASAGQHPGSARPLMIKTDNATDFTSLLARATVGTNRAHHDALIAAYNTQYDARLTWPDQGRVRSAKTDDASVAYTSTTQVDAIKTVLTDDGGADLFARRSGTACGVSGTTDIPTMGLHAARHLLTHPTAPASYVCVSDTGLYEASGGGGYDTHTDNARDTANNFDNLLNNLLAMINGPGETDATKLSLDDTLIILNTEFGRTPRTQSGNGRNHHPYGYTSVFIGGPITSAQKGVYGAIGPDGVATTFANPAENRMAALLALGIWPYAPEGFNVSNVQGAVGELDGATKVMQKFLGRTQ